MTRISLFARDVMTNGIDPSSPEALPFLAIVAACAVLLGLFLFPPDHPR